jgi:hypothetical protein
MHQALPKDKLSEFFIFAEQQGFSLLGSANTSASPMPGCISAHGQYLMAVQAQRRHYALVEILVGEENHAARLGCG